MSGSASSLVLSAYSGCFHSLRSPRFAKEVFQPLQHLIAGHVRGATCGGAGLELEASSRRERAKRAGACCRNPERGRLATESKDLSEMGLLVGVLVAAVGLELEASSRRERAKRAGACCRNAERGRLATESKDLSEMGLLVGVLVAAVGLELEASSGRERAERSGSLLPKC